MPLYYVAVPVDLEGDDLLLSGADDKIVTEVIAKRIGVDSSSVKIDRIAGKHTRGLPAPHQQHGTSDPLGRSDSEEVKFETETKVVAFVSSQDCRSIAIGIGDEGSAATGLTLPEADVEEEGEREHDAAVQLGDAAPRHTEDAMSIGRKPTSPSPPALSPLGSGEEEEAGQPPAEKKNPTTESESARQGEGPTMEGELALATPERETKKKDQQKPIQKQQEDDAEKALLRAEIEDLRMKLAEITTFKNEVLGTIRLMKREVAEISEDVLLSTV